jgi:hypothetical protein
MEKQKKFELIISELAEQELNASKDFYDVQREGLGNEFLTEIEKTIDRITAVPEQFPKKKKYKTNKSGKLMSLVSHSVFSLLQKD